MTTEVPRSADAAEDAALRVLLGSAVGAWFSDGLAGSGGVLDPFVQLPVRETKGMEHRGNVGPARGSSSRRPGSPHSGVNRVQQPGSRKLAIRVCQPLPSGACAAPSTV